MRVTPNELHADYVKAAPGWARARDVFAGEAAVKARGEADLPRLDSQSDAEYGAYLGRASFCGAAGRALEDAVELVFRRRPEEVTGGGIGAAFFNDCDGEGLRLADYARAVLGELLRVGRAATLVRWDGGAARVRLLRAEEVLNWSSGEGADGPMVAYGVDGLVMPLAVRDGVCGWELDRKDGEAWVRAGGGAMAGPGGTAVSFLPVVFHGACALGCGVGPIPMVDLVDACLEHYRLDADYKHGLHLCALPTAWVSGFDRSAPLRVGSNEAWVSEDPGATAGFLEYSGQGLGHLETALARVEARMAGLGARFVGGGGGQVSGLGGVVRGLNAGLARIVELGCWRGGPLGAELPPVYLRLNEDFGARGVTPEEITALVGAWRAGGISRETMLEGLQRGGLLPEGRSAAQEKALVHGAMRAG